MATIPPPTTWAAPVPPPTMGCERTELGTNGSHSTSHITSRLVAATRPNRVHFRCGLVVSPRAALHPALRRRSSLWLRVSAWCDPVGLAPTVARIHRRTRVRCPQRIDVYAKTGKATPKSSGHANAFGVGWGRPNLHLRLPRTFGSCGVGQR